MPAVGSGLPRGEIVVQMQEACAGNVRGLVLGTPARRVGQIVTAIEHDPIGMVEALREDFGADQRCEDHAAILLAAGTQKF